MIEIQIAVELMLAAFAGGILVALVWPTVLGLARHRGPHNFQHAFAYLLGGMQRDVQLCQCGAFRQIDHDGRMCRH